MFGYINKNRVIKVIEDRRDNHLKWYKQYDDLAKQAEFDGELEERDQYCDDANEHFGLYHECCSILGILKYL